MRQGIHLASRVVFAVLCLTAVTRSDPITLRLRAEVFNVIDSPGTFPVPPIPLGTVVEATWTVDPSLSDDFPGDPEHGVYSDLSSDWELSVQVGNLFGFSRVLPGTMRTTVDIRGPVFDIYATTWTNLETETGVPIIDSGFFARGPGIFTDDALPLAPPPAVLFSEERPFGFRGFLSPTTFWRVQAAITEFERVEPIPEPGTLWLAGAVAVGFGLVRRRRARAS